MSSLYSRQKELKLTVPEKAIVVGVGGIGSWVAIDLALVGVQELILIDHDIVEEHNLNRTLFKYSQIGKNKAIAMIELIAERRTDIEIKAYDCRWEEVDIDTKDYIIFDCRDTTTPLIRGAIKLGYDGLNFTIDPHSGRYAFGENSGYTIVPSFFGTPQLISALVVSYIVNNKQLPFVANKSILEVLT